MDNTEYEVWQLSIFSLKINLPLYSINATLQILNIRI